jgi:hypothetical protein
MSLQVWLPLNGNLENNGLAKVTVTNNGATVANNGKLGQCYSFGGSSYIACSNPNIDGGNISACCWAYLNSVDSTRYLISLNDSAGFADQEIGIGIESGNVYFVAGGKYSLFVNCTQFVNKWVHLAVTFDGNKIVGYVNGISIGSVSHNTKLNRTKFSLGARWNESTNNYIYFLNGRLNDVRIYDHCLSDKEVHDIAQGLVLHYKLDDPYEESTKNLATVSSNYSNMHYGQIYNCSGWGGDAGTCQYFGSGGYNNGPYKVYHKTATGDGGIYKRVGLDILIEAGKTYTMSVYVKSNRDYYDSPHSFNINRSEATAVSSGNRYITYGQSVHFTTEWTRISKTFTATDADAGVYGEMSIIYNDDVKDYYVYYSCFQIEEGDHATEFVPGGVNLFEGKTDISNTSVWPRYKANSPESTINNKPTADSYTNIILYGGGSKSEGYTYTQSYIHNANIARHVNLLPNTTYTLSVCVKQSSTTARFNMYLYERDENNANTKINSIYKFCTAEQVGKWIVYDITFTTKSNTRKCYVELNCYTSPIGDTVTVLNNSLKLLQEGADGVRIGKVIDCSGYRNDGEITGTLSLDSVTPRYKLCTQFNGDAYISGPINKGEVQSVSFWLFVPSVIPTTSTIIFVDAASKIAAGYYNSGTDIILTCVDTVSGKGAYGTENLIKNAWNHIAIIRTSSNVTVYFNAILQTSKRGDYWTLSANSEFTIGRRQTTTPNAFTGKISDFRMYTTALSESDVQELYHTGGYIDNQSDIQCYEFIEDETTPQVNKTGIINAKKLIENSADYLYLPAKSYINTGLFVPASTAIKAETIIRYETGGSGSRDLMGFSPGAQGYWGVKADSTWELHGTFSYTDADITKLNRIEVEWPNGDQYSGNYRIGQLDGRYSTRNKFIYHVKLWLSGTLERDLYPATVDNQIGMIDIAHNVFYPVKGTTASSANLGDDPSEDKARFLSDHIESKQFIEI